MAALEKQCPEWGAASLDRIDGHLADLDARLRGRDFIAAGRFTVADITALVAVDYLRILKRSIPDNLEHLRAWHERVKARPSAMAGMKEKTA